MEQRQKWSWLIILFALIARAQMPTSASTTEPGRAAYVLGVDDQLVIQVEDLDEFKGDHPIRVDMQGNIRLPIVGRLHVAGLTVEQTEGELRKSLGTVLKDPQVTVLVAEFRSHPVSVLGSVKNPGVVQITGTKTLYEVLASAGGANPDAGNAILITRPKATGPLPLPDAQLDASGRFYVGHVNLKGIMDARNLQENIAIEFGDVITVPKGELIYIVGAVLRQGGIVLNERETLTILQVISLSGGFDRFANQKEVRILRPKAGTSDREEIFVDVKAMLASKKEDLPLLANDILYVPVSGKKAATVRAVEAVIGMGTTIGSYSVIYR
jgi:polysaccharide export outer membrane protein